MIATGVYDVRQSTLAIVAGLLLIGFAAVGVLRGRAFLRFGGVDRRKEPIGFWLTIVVQGCMGLFALIYGVFGRHL